MSQLRHGLRMRWKRGTYMYYHTPMRLLAMLILFVLIPMASEARSERARFTLTEIWPRQWVEESEADWQQERFFEGIDWQIGTVSRGDGEVMIGGFTVVHPYQSEPFSLRHCYVLAAFDMLPRGYLLVTVRDPEYYWPEYDVIDATSDPLELVWYDEDWQEDDRVILDYGEHEYPDDFLLSPDEKTLLSITHPLPGSKPLADKGQTIKTIDLRSGAVEEVWLPDVDGYGNLPPQWWPVRMQWGKHNNLEVQAGKELRIYLMRWE